MFERIIILLCLILIINPNIIKAEDFTPELIKEKLENSSIINDKNNLGHTVTITYEDNKLTINDTYEDYEYKTILENQDNTLTYSSSDDKEILKESTIWIEEITNIVLSNFGYDTEVINNINLKNYTYENNGIEGVKNEYIDNEEKIYYYFYYKINLNNVNLDENDDTEEEVTPTEDTTITDSKEENNINKKEDVNTNNVPSIGLYIEIFCAIIAIIMLIINAATKSD